MTALCGGGTSSAKSGFGATVQVGTGAISGLFSNIPTPLAVAIGGYIGLINFDLTNFCATDPPAMPTLTAGDYAAALLLTDPAAHATALSKFEDALGAMLWPQFCKCDTGSTPAAPGPPTPPSGLPTVNPVGLPSGPAAACFNGNASPVLQNNTSGPVVQDVTGAVLPTGGAPVTMTVGVDPFLNPVNVYPIPPTVQSVTFNTNTLQSSGTQPEEVDFFVLDHTSGIGSRFTIAQAAPGASGSITLSPSTTPGAIWPANSTHYGVAFGAKATTPAAGPQQINLDTVLQCGGNPLQTPCCPPDPQIQATLSTILSLVQQVYAGLPTPLHSYASSTTHTGLTGNGSIVIGHSTIAIRVDATAIPASLGLTIGDPDFHFDMGYVVPLVNTYALSGETRLVYASQMYLLPALTDSVGYSLHSGVSVTITELTAGP